MALCRHSWKCEFNTWLRTWLFFNFILINMVDQEHVISGPGLDHLFWKFSSLSSLLLKFVFDVPFLCICKTHFFGRDCDSSINAGAHVVLGKIKSHWSEAKSPPFPGDFCLKQGIFSLLRMMLRWPVETHTFAGRIWRWAFIYPKWIVIPVYRVGFFVASVLLLLASLQMKAGEGTSTEVLVCQYKR